MKHDISVPASSGSKESQETSNTNRRNWGIHIWKNQNPKELVIIKLHIMCKL